jgi:hypothetical protein
MISEIETLERELAVDKVALSENVSALEKKARAMTDWRAPITKHPWDAIGLAIIGGGILGMLGSRRRSRRTAAAGPADAAPTVDEPRQPSFAFRALEALGTMASVQVLRSLQKSPEPDGTDHA